MVRAAVGRGPDAGAGDASHAAGIPLGRRLVAGLFDPAVSPRFRAEAAGDAAAAAGFPVRAAFARLWATAQGLRSHKQAFLMLLAFLIYNDGIGTIIRMATIYGTEIGINQTTMIAAIMIVQFVGIPVRVSVRDAGPSDRRQAIDRQSGWSRTWRSAFSAIS